MGDPQFPICRSSHGRVGVWSARASPHQAPSGEVAMLLFSRSQRERAKYLPSIRRGNSAIPLFWAAGPASWDIRKCRKSWVSMSCGVIDTPSNAV
jgi:hypothetical protein